MAFTRRVNRYDGSEPAIRRVFRLNMQNRRLELGIKQSELGRRVGEVRQQWVSQLESPAKGSNFKEPSLQELEQIAIALDTTPHC
jgi:transcriptional regulator with XRE-family HTH domain